MPPSQLNLIINPALEHLYTRKRLKDRLKEFISSNYHLDYLICSNQQD